MSWKLITKILDELTTKKIDENMPSDLEAHTYKITQKLLNELVPDDKERTPIYITSFGDIVYKETNKNGDYYCSLLRIAYHNNTGNKQYRFDFKINIITKNNTHFFKKIKSHRENGEMHWWNLYLLPLAIEEQGKLADQQVYAYYGNGETYGLAPVRKILSITEYYTQILAYLKTHEIQNTDLYELNRLNDSRPPDFIKKLYFSYNNTSIPDTIYQCINLADFALWNQSLEIKADFVKWENLNHLTIRNVYSYKADILNAIHQLKYLTTLTINTESEHCEKLTLIPQKLFMLKGLKQLDLSHNKLDEVWEEICKLNKLKTLKLGHNQINQISSKIKNLQRLEYLDLSNNFLTELPVELKELKKLKVLNLNKNPLKKLPNWISEMESLEVLDLTQTQLENFPESILNLKLKELRLKKNCFVQLPQKFIKFPKRSLALEERFKALYDDKIKEKMKSYPQGTCLFENDFNLKLMVIQKLMYEDEVLLPKFNIWDFAENYTERNINIEEEGYNIIPEAVAYFKKLAIPMEMLIDIKELLPDGGDEIYAQIIPLDGIEDDTFEVQSIEDIDYLFNLKKVNSMNLSKDVIKALRKKKIKVSDY